MTTLWNRGLVGKLSVGFIGILVLCCIFGVVSSRLRRQRPVVSQAPTTQAIRPAPPTQEVAAQTTAVFAPEVATIQPAITAPTDLPTLIPVSIQPLPVTEQPTPLLVAPIQPPAPSVSAAKLTRDERVAVLEIGQQLIAIGKGLTEIGRLASTFENTTEWRTNVASQIANVRQAHNAILAMKVPPKIDTLRTDVLNATSDCAAAMDAFTTVLDTNNLAALKSGIALLQSCGEKMRATQPEFEALRSQL